MQRQHWAIVLAAGSGTRLQEMTGRQDGRAVPKQYCSLHGGPSLLRLALARACRVVPRDRVLCVVAKEHEEWWERELGELPAENVIVQPINRGTAVGALLPLLIARSRDPSPRLVFLPADHYVAEEPVFTRAISAAFRMLEQHSRHILLLGLEPSEADSELGYILSTRASQALIQQVVRYVEKPTTHYAQTLIRGGALWNSFVFAAEADVLLTLFQKRIPEALAAFGTVGNNPTGDANRLAEIYLRLVGADLSRDVFEGAEDHLAVLRVPPCGWTDLGTPERVARCLAGSTNQSLAMRPVYHVRPTHVDLASACHSTFLSTSN